MNILDFIKKAEKEKILPIQITELIDNSTEIKFVNEKQKKHITSSETNYEIKAKRNNKFIKVNTNYLDTDIIELIKYKSNYIENNYEDSFIEEQKTSKDVENNIEIDVNEIIEEISNLNVLSKKYKNIDSIEAYYEKNKLNKRIVNSYGADISSSKTIQQFNIEATIKQEKNVSKAENITYKNGNKKIDISQIAKEIFEEVQLGTRVEKLENKKYLTLLSSRFMSKILVESVSLFSKEDVRKQMSCLKDLLNKKVFSTKINIIEDPQNKEYPGYTIFDNEGTTTTKKYIVKNGKIKTFLYNIKEAKIDNKTSTGNGYDKIFVRNLYIEPGEKSLENIISSIKDGLYIKDYASTGGVSLNKTTGEISLQVFGYIIKNGKIISSFDTCILTTTIFDLLKNVKDVANNLEFKTLNVGSPAILIENMSISSN